MEEPPEEPRTVTYTLDEVLLDRRDRLNLESRVPRPALPDARERLIPSRGNMGILHDGEFHGNTPG